MVVVDVSRKLPGEDIGVIVGRRDVVDGHISFADFVANEMVVTIDVLGELMVDGVTSNRDSRFVVFPDVDHLFQVILGGAAELGDPLSLLGRRGKLVCSLNLH